MGDEAAAFADDDIRSDDAIRPIAAPAAIFAPAATRAVESIDVHTLHAVAIMAPTSASATTAPATRASPRNHHMVLRLAILVM